MRLIPQSQNLKLRLSINTSFDIFAPLQRGTLLQKIIVYAYQYHISIKTHVETVVLDRAQIARYLGFRSFEIN